MGGLTVGPASFSSLGDIPSGPVDLLGFNDSIFLLMSISRREMLDMAGTSGFSGSSVIKVAGFGSSFVRFSPMLAK